jgi:arylsulfatase A
MPLPSRFIASRLRSSRKLIMTKKTFGVSALALAFFCCLYNPTQAVEPTNVIVVLADDLGIGDITPTNPKGKIRTPHLQKMADEGLVFLDAHTPSSVCTPTRYGLMTGRYNWRSRLARGVLSGTSEHMIPADRPTVGHLMRASGYHTAMIGKWHLGWDWHKTDGEIDFAQPIKNGPDINGFDKYYAHCGSLDMPPYVWVNTGHATALPNREEGVTKDQDRYGWYRKGPISPDFKIDEVLPHLFDKSMDHIRERSQDAIAGKPFFLYLALPAPHTPIVPVAPFKDASGLNPYADFVIQVDHHMGQLLATLQECKVDENTLVIFTSDNGCSPEANFEVLKEHDHDPSAGYRGHKADIYEGGHRVPMIARWPKRIKAGQRTSALVCLTDIYTTLQEMTDQPRQATGGEDGFSLLPVFDGEPSTQRDTLVSHSIGGSFAIRKGPWKLCLAAGSGGWSAPKEPEAKKKGLPPMQLFNLQSDPAESTNVAADNPGKVDELLELLKTQVEMGRCTPGTALANDREVEFLPPGDY